MKDFIQIARYLEDPFVLIGFALFLFFGIHRLLIKSKIIKPLTGKEGSKVVRLLLRYGFIISLITVLGGFGYKSYQIYVTKGDKVQRGEVAFAQVKKEILDNFAALSLLIGTIENLKPSAFWDVRRINETELAYQDRAKNYFRDYLHGVRLHIEEPNFSTAVFKSFQHDLSFIDADSREHIENTYSELNKVGDVVGRYEKGLTHILSLNLNDHERTARSISLHKEKIVDVKIAISFAASRFCLVLKDKVDAGLLTDYLKASNINISLEPGTDGYQTALQVAARFSKERADILSERVIDAETAKKREIERRIKDPYLIMLRKAVGLPETLSESEIIALQKKAIDMDEDDPGELVKLAGLSYLESEGHASVIYYERALRIKRLSNVQKQFIQLSLDRLKNPDKFEGSIGIMILKVNPGGNFDKSGLKVGDVIVSVDGKTIYEPMDIASALGKGGKAPFLLRVIRGDKPLKIVIKGGESAGTTLTQLIVLNPIQL